MLIFPISNSYSNLRLPACHIQSTHCTIHPQNQLFGVQYFNNTSQHQQDIPELSLETFNPF